MESGSRTTIERGERLIEKGALPWPFVSFATHVSAFFLHEGAENRDAYAISEQYLYLQFRYILSKYTDLRNPSALHG